MRYMKSFWTFAFAVILGLGLMSCDDDDGRQNLEPLRFTFSGMTALGTGSVYGIWLKENDEYNFLDVFTVNSAGIPDNSQFGLESERLDDVQGILITLENEDNIGTEPSDTRLMAGEFINRGALLEISHPDAMNVDFSTSSVSYMLASPTDDNADNENAGIWFANTVDGTSTLDLPDLPTGWIYESWVLLPDTVVSLGQFANPLMRDDSDAHSGPNPQNGYNAPGGDLLTGDPEHFPASLHNNLISITVEPSEDDNSNAFGIRPFSIQVMDTIPTAPVNIEYRESGVARGFAVRG